MRTEDGGAAGTRRLDPGREHAILDAALGLLAEVGYDRMSIDQIARRAGASKATIYRRWTGKPEIVVDVICHRMDLAVAEPPDTGSLRGDLVALCRSLCETLEVKRDLVLGLIPTLLADPELATALRAHLPGQNLTGMVLVLGRARERGDLAGPVEPAEPVAVVEAMIFRQMFFGGRPLDDEFVRSTVDRVLLPLIRAWTA
ncbi:TetR family transcriptional regulator [Microtetraspora sp. NBRC 13810]|uniref:TetR/AcrR family transcriptional regulator n=1 Tax=Microtetraspora sp. NBRC 13810 TaxID=3030990 RepID=UPI0024A0FFF0|nr:TetR/AcrR family transcriptional regulator [Microtetraspora sp. NBRC 13810]GLW06635.1 TetR family transcriptional regulator [Microtetraspora sp. NBRC 13810]